MHCKEKESDRFRKNVFSTFTRVYEVYFAVIFEGGVGGATDDMYTALPCQYL